VTPDTPRLPTILVVDDDPPVLDLILAVLQRHGYAPVSTSNAHQAVQLVQTQTFDILIADLVMPRFRGDEVIKAARRLNPDVQVILVTAHAAVQTPRVLEALGPHTLLQKPFDIDRLVDAVARAADSARAVWNAAGEAQECASCGRVIKPGAPRRRRGEDTYHPGCYELAAGARPKKTPRPREGDERV
jgi:DNA-binding NtrC family response regulator